jgi:phage-related tail fiber protein
MSKTYNNATLSSSLTGSIAYFPLSNPPAGWLKSDGSEISRTEYAELFAIIGTEFGSGNGTTTFNLPDLRGEFVRCWDDGKGTDSGRAINSSQSHDWKGFYQTNTGQNTFSYSHIDVYMGKSIVSYIGNLFVGGWSAPAAAMGTKWDDSEIRPRNIALLACIKT